MSKELKRETEQKWLKALRAHYEQDCDFLLEVITPEDQPLEFRRRLAAVRDSLKDAITNIKLLQEDI